MGQPQPPTGTTTRAYRVDAEYQGDAMNMAAAGWFVTAVRRAPDGSIVASYAYHAPLAPPPVNAPMAPVGDIKTVATPSRGVEGWLARQSPVMLTSLGVGGVLTLLLCVVLVTLLAAPASHPAMTGAMVATAAPTATTSATATISTLPTSAPLPSPVDGPYVGGTLDSFAATFGPPDSQGHWQNATVNGTHVTLDIGGTAIGDSEDGQLRAVVIDIRPATSGVTWTASSAAHLAMSFLPPDAVHTGDATSQMGVDHHYTSAALTGSLAPSAFTYNGSGEAPDGTLDWTCHVTSPGRVDVCEIGAGYAAS